jgi:hypothetical protein
MTVRAVTPEDMPLLQEWSAARGLDLVPEFLSPHGFLASDEHGPALAVWAYMILDVPVIQLDHLVSRPALSLRLLREAWDSLIRTVEYWVRIINKDSGLRYRALRCFCDGRLLKEAKRESWTASEPQYFQIIKALN